jgi:hypothetical protein
MTDALSQANKDSTTIDNSHNKSAIKDGRHGWFTTPEMSTIRQQREEIKKLQRMLEIAKDLVMDCNIYDIYESKCREEGLIPEREDDEDD